MISKSQIADLKTEMKAKIGQKIIIKGTLGRNKNFEEEATISNTYGDIFIVKYDGKEPTASYKYTDLLTRELEVEVFDGVCYNPLLPPMQKQRKIHDIK